MKKVEFLAVRMIWRIIAEKYEKEFSTIALRMTDDGRGIAGLFMGSSLSSRLFWVK